MITIITSKFGVVTVDNESFVTYYTNEHYCDKNGKPSSEDDLEAFNVADLIIETSSMRVRFPKLYLGKDYFLEMREEAKVFYYADKHNKQLVELEKLLDFSGEMKMIGSDSIVVETK